MLNIKKTRCHLLKMLKYFVFQKKKPNFTMLKQRYFLSYQKLMT